MTTTYPERRFLRNLAMRWSMTLPMIEVNRPKHRVLLGLLALTACTRHNPRSCQDGLCSDPALPFCDVDGTVEGAPNTCVAIDCMPMDFVACRGETALRCNATGNNLDIVQCDDGCDDIAGGCVIPRVPFIVFTSDRDGNSEIYRMNPDGTLQTNLTNNAGLDSSPLWDATGERIAFLSDRDGGVQQLYTMKPDGSEVVNVSNGPAASPAWSADGARLAFTSDRDGSSEIYLASSAGSNVTRLTRIGNADRASWAPDGSRIAFESNGKIFVVNVDGTGATSISQGAVRGDHAPAWRSDGTKIAFARGLTFENSDVFIMNADGSMPVDVTENAGTTTFEQGATWSPDGMYLAGDIFESVTGQPTSGQGIFVVDVGSMTFDNIVLPPAARPCWSSDGAVLYESNRSGDSEIYAVSRSGGSGVNLTSSAGEDTQCTARPR